MSLYPLPSLILFEDFNGDWKSYKHALYQVFLNSIVNKLTFLTLPVSCRYFKPIDETHRCFWHLISEGPQNDEDRIPDMRRCERISWIPNLIKNFQDSTIKCWENKRGSNNNIVLWLPPENYMIILSQRKNYYLLTTAYVHKDIKKRSNHRQSEECRDPRKS